MRLTARELRSQALGDQTWAVMAERLPDIERIAVHGLDGSDRDARIAQMVCCAVTGRLLWERYEMQKLEGDAPCR